MSIFFITMFLPFHSQRDIAPIIVVLLVLIFLAAGGVGYIMYKGISKQHASYSSCTEDICIVFPPNGTIVTPGQTIKVIVVTPHAHFLSVGLLGKDLILKTSQTGSPYEFTIPSTHFTDENELGNYDITAMGIRGPEDGVFSTTLHLDLEVPENVHIISLNARYLEGISDPTVTLEHTYSSGDPVSQKFLRVKGLFSDGKERDVALSTHVHYVSQDETIATVATHSADGTNAPGMHLSPYVRGVKAGRTGITVSYDNVSTIVPVVVESSNAQPVAKILPEHGGSGATLPPVRVGTSIKLDGNTSYDPDGDTISFHWVLDKPTESRAAIVNKFDAVTELVPDVPGHYGIKLGVADGQGGSDDDSVGFTVGGPISLTKSIVSVSPSRIPADGKTKALITVSVQNDNEQAVPNEPLVLYYLSEGHEYPYGYCDVIKSDATGKATFEVDGGLGVVDQRFSWWKMGDVTASHSNSVSLWMFINSGVAKLLYTHFSRVRILS